MNKNNFKINDIVYIIDPYDFIYKCQIEDIHKDKNNNNHWYKVHNLERYGTQGTLAENTFSSREEAEQELLNRAKQRYNNYKDTIKTKEDLLNRMYQEICMQEFLDYELAQVIREKTKELFDIDLINEY